MTVILKSIFCCSLYVVQAQNDCVAKFNTQFMYHKWGNFRICTHSYIYIQLHGIMVQVFTFAENKDSKNKNSNKTDLIYYIEKHLKLLLLLKLVLKK